MKSALKVPDTKAKPGHDEMVSQSMEQVDNYMVKPESFPAKGGLAKGYTENANKIGMGVSSPSYLEDNGDLTPSVWGKGGKAFKVETSKGESDEGSPSKVSIDCSVDLKTGHHA